MKTRPNVVAAIAAVFLCSAVAPAASADAKIAQKKIQKEDRRIPVAIIGSFTSLAPIDSVTDQNLLRGLKVFEENRPKDAQRFRFTTHDLEGKPDRVPAVLAEIHKAGIRLIIGVARSNMALVVKQHLPADTIFITPFATKPEVTAGTNNIFRTCFTDSDQAAAAVGYLRSMHVKRLLAPVNLDEAHSVGLNARITSLWPTSTTARFSYVGEELDQSALQKTARDANVDAAYIPDYAQRAVRIAEMLLAVNPRMTLMGSDGWGLIDVMRKFKTSFPDAQLRYSTHWHPAIDNPMSRQYLEGFRRNWPDRDPSTAGALMFDTMSIVAKVVEKPADVDVKKFRKKLLGRSFDTVTGAARFNRNDNSPTRPLVIVSPTTTELKLETTVVPVTDPS